MRRKPKPGRFISPSPTQMPDPTAHIRPTHLKFESGMQHNKRLECDLGIYTGLRHLLRGFDIIQSEELFDRPARRKSDRMQSRLIIPFFQIIASRARMCCIGNIDRRRCRTDECAIGRAIHDAFNI